MRSGGDDDAISIVRCPGAWELPQVVRKVIERGGIDAVVALGAVIRGATPHFDLVAGEAARGIASAAATATIPVSFGVLTTDTIEQALERAGTKAGNKGFDAAIAAIELATLFRALAGTGPKAGGEGRIATVMTAGHAARDAPTRCSCCTRATATLRPTSPAPPPNGRTRSSSRSSRRRKHSRAIWSRPRRRGGEVDELITSSSKNWRIDRMSRVDRNILRLGACELLAFHEVPVKVVIDEAVELAKRFGTAESSAFVNGVLDRIATAVGRSAED